MSYLFTSESVSEGHPDKVADQISDALLDNFLAFDEHSKVACETMVTTGQVILAGEVSSKIYLDVQNIAREVITNIGYNKDSYKFNGETCGVITLIHEQSTDIRQGVDQAVEEEQGAGDQGMMFGYATKETEEYMPVAHYIANKILMELAAIRKEGKEMTYLGPDAKSQVTIEYTDDNIPQKVVALVISTQHDDFDTDERMQAQIQKDIQEILIPNVIQKLSPDNQKLFGKDIIYHINPTGRFVIGGPHGDVGLTGRKIIVDTYGGKGAHGGGAFSGKDPSKVDRSAAYAARHIAKNMVAAGVADEILVQVSYAIGKAEPTSISVDTYGRSNVDLTNKEITEKIKQLFDMRPASIEKRLKLRNPIYQETAAYGHMGRSPQKVTKTFTCVYSGKVEKEVELFTWEKLDYVDKIKQAFKL